MSQPSASHSLTIRSAFLSSQAVPQPSVTLRRRDVLALVGASSLLLSQAAQAEAELSASALPAVGSNLVLPPVTLLDGTAWKPLPNQMVVIYWWASWCPFCMIQSPYIEKLWQAQHANGLQVLGLSLDRQIKDAKNYLSRKKYSFPSAMFNSSIAQVLPKPKGLPVVIVRGKDGLVRHAESGEMFPDDIERIGSWVKS